MVISCYIHKSNLNCSPIFWESSRMTGWCSRTKPPWRVRFSSQSCFMMQSSFSLYSWLCTLHVYISHRRYIRDILPNKYYMLSNIPWIFAGCLRCRWGRWALFGEHLDPGFPSRFYAAVGFTQIAMEAMAHRNRWFSYIWKMVICPWQTVSHNQMVLETSTRSEVYQKVSLFRGTCLEHGPSQQPCSTLEGTAPWERPLQNCRSGNVYD